MTYTHETALELDCTVYYDYRPGRPAKILGPPEDCYPEDPEELEITKIVFRTNGLEWEVSGTELGENQYDWAVAELMEKRNGRV